MDSSGMNMKGETVEQAPQLEVKRLDKSTFKQYEQQILSLSRNALDTSEGTGFAERESEVKGLFGEYLGSTPHGEMFIAVKNDAVLAFVGLKKNLNPEDSNDKDAEIEQFRYAAGLHKPGHVLRQMLLNVKTSLEKETFHHATVQTADHNKVSKYRTISWFERFFDTENPDASGDTVSSEDKQELQG